MYIRCSLLLLNYLTCYGLVYISLILFDDCVWAAMLLMFFTFFRQSNVLPLSASQFDPSKQLSQSSISLYSDFMVVKVTWSKTIQFSQKTFFVPIAAVSGSNLCPVSAYRSLLDLVPIAPCNSAFCYLSHGNPVILTYTAFVKQFRIWLSELGLSPNMFSCHSFRRGGATWAFQSGVPDIIIKAQGDWSSDCYMRYSNFSIADRLVASVKMSKSISDIKLKF